MPRDAAGCRAGAGRRRAASRSEIPSARTGASPSSSSLSAPKAS